jgi:hypothetical protein
VSVFQEVAIPAEHDQSTDYFPVYFQACKGASPIESGVDFLAFTSLVPTLISTGISIKVTGQYRLQSWIGWIITVVALGLMNTIIATDSLVKSIGCVALLGFGIGCVAFVGLRPMLQT